MAEILSRGKIFDPVLVTDLISKVKGKSALAVLSAQTPIPFNGQEQFVFSMDDEVDLVAENGKKSRGSIALAPTTIVPLKVEYGARISDEFVYASEESKIDILKSFNDGFAKKVARGLDIMASRKWKDFLRTPKSFRDISTIFPISATLSTLFTTCRIILKLRAQRRMRRQALFQVLLRV